MPCVFCQIVKGKIPAEIVYQDNDFVVFKDIHPSAKIHLLVVPRRHIKSINSLRRKDKEFIGQMILTAQKVAKKMKIAQKGYKLVFNVGRGGGQVIDHLHLHLLAGKLSSNAKKSIVI